MKLQFFCRHYSRRRLAAFLIALLLFCLLSGCRSGSGAGSDQLTESCLIGEWDCRETPLSGDEYTGYLRLTISADGTFSMYDVEAGNPGIAGKLAVVSEDRLRLTKLDSVDFDPPHCWDEMEATDQEIFFQLVTDQELHLTYPGGGTLVFDKIDSE